jgi:hypothetical protein
VRTRMAMTAVVYAIGSYSFGGGTMAQGGSAGAAKNVVLVHGAVTDDSSWSKHVSRDTRRCRSYRTKSRRAAPSEAYETAQRCTCFSVAPVPSRSASAISFRTNGRSVSSGPLQSMT